MSEKYLNFKRPRRKKKCDSMRVLINGELRARRVKSFSVISEKQNLSVLTESTVCKYWNKNKLQGCEVILSDML